MDHKSSRKQKPFGELQKPAYLGSFVPLMLDDDIMGHLDFKHQKEKWFHFSSSVDQLKLLCKWVLASSLTMMLMLKAGDWSRGRGGSQRKSCQVTQNNCSPHITRPNQWWWWSVIRSRSICQQFDFSLRTKNQSRICIPCKVMCRDQDIFLKDINGVFCILRPWRWFYLFL